VIVRIAIEGQYELGDDEQASLNELDNEAVLACEADDEQRFNRTFSSLIELVRQGQPVGDDDLRPSDVILPPADVSLDEARAGFSGEGLIPG
jgi:hypothetical protein